MTTSSFDLTLTRLRESSLLCWINLHYPIDSLEKFQEKSILILLIQSLFPFTLNLSQKDMDDEEYVYFLLNKASMEEKSKDKSKKDITVDSKREKKVIDILGLIQTQYQLYFTMNYILQNPELSFTNHIHNEFIQSQCQDMLYSWSLYILSDYIGASLLTPINDFCISNWKNGLYLLAILHHHNPFLVPDLHLYISQQNTTSTSVIDTILVSFGIAFESFNVPYPLHISSTLDFLNSPDPQIQKDEQFFISYLFQLISKLVVPTNEQNIQRHRDMERFKNSNFTSTTLTSTFTLQQLKITKTTVLKYSDGTEVPTDLEEFESRASALTEKINHLQHRLVLIVPTRSATSYSPSSVTSDSIEFFLTDDNTTTSSHHSIDNLNTDIIQLAASKDLVSRILHPLQAAEEDYSAYDRNFKSLQSEFQTLTDGDLQLLYTYLNEQLDPVWHNHPKVLWRQSQLQQLHNVLNSEFERSEAVLSHFRRGFAFARMCSSIRQELDLVQNKMVKSITTHHDIEELENSMEKTTNMVTTLKTNFSDLLYVGTGEHGNELSGGTLVLMSGNTTPVLDSAYLIKYESIESKNKLVQTWVEEVRIWFAEAERIRQWIEIRIDDLNTTPLPQDPLTTLSVPATREQVEALNASHSMLEKEIEAFDKEDMARLRSHVKTLTGSGRADKDLSPADTTTIEITLTTLMTLDKLIHSLRKKSYDLQVLTHRVSWEEEYMKAMGWLKETDLEIDSFLHTSARWTAIEDDEDEDDVSSNTIRINNLKKREKLMQKEKQKESIVQQLLKLEKKMQEFDQGQFTKTVDSFQDLDNTSSVELPSHLEQRQDQCEQLFEDLMKRMAFARNVVEQRLNVMDFLYQTDMVWEDAHSLRLDLDDAENKVHPGDNDREMTARVQNMHERIVQLVTATASRIPYPAPALEVDMLTNTAANEEINQVVTSKRTRLIELSEDLDERLFAFRSILQLHRKGKEHLDDAVRLCDWADERVKNLKKSKVNLQDTLTIDDLQRLERDRDNILAKLRNGKENDVVDLLTRIQQLLEMSQKSGVTSIDKEGLTEVSQQLEERFDRLQTILEKHGLDLEALRKKLQDGHAYFENARSLRSFINETRHSMPSLKQTCGFMTGQSEEQDNRRFEMLNKSLGTINSSYQVRQAQFTELCNHFNLMEPSKTENTAGLKELQDSLENDWNCLATEIKDLKEFAEVVGQWYNRQRRLSMVENELIAGLNDEIAQLARAGWSNAELDAIQAKIDRASTLLEETGSGIINSGDNKEDPLQTANYACARDRHSLLAKKVDTCSTNLDALRSNANKALAFSAFLSESDKLLHQVQDEKEVMGRRMAHVGASGFSLKSAQEIDAQYKSTQTATDVSRATSQSLLAKLSALVVIAKELESEGYDVNAVAEPIRAIQENLGHLNNNINLEKKQAIFIRKIYIHAKAAADLQTWIDGCSNAITQLPTDVCMADEQELNTELDNIELKMAEMRPTFEVFEVMESRIFVTKDELPLDLPELGLDRNEIKESVLARERMVMKAWNALKKQHAQARNLVDSSKRGVEIARKVKAILTQVGDYKDRVTAVRICRNTQLGESIENRDLKTVLSCPLTSIPTEHRLSSAKAELTIIDRDIESHLQSAIQELDSMLVNNQDDIFSGQRTEITIAVRGLADLLKTKRRAIAEAEKMEGFLTVLEELEVLLLALGEVVSRAAPENARIVDGHYSRTDLQALLIDLDTRYRYYEPKINELFDELKQVSENLLDDRRVVDCVCQLSNKWSDLQAEAAAKKAELMSLIGPLAETFDSLQTTEGILHEHGKRAVAQQEQRLQKRFSSPVLNAAPSPKVMQSTPRYMTGYNRGPTSGSVAGAPTATVARANARKSATGGTVSPVARRVAARTMAAQKTRQRVYSTVTSAPPLPSQIIIQQEPKVYVADPQNDLDVALGDIVNDSPYKIKIKMVPGEVGKYWFGDVNPKLAYCRILRSRMVMVRVGGGWVELSQFLRDHALLEGGHFYNPHGGKSPSRAGARDGFLNTAVGRNPPHYRREGDVVSVRGGGNGPVLRESRSTPFNQSKRVPSPPVPMSHGIKSGNKFLVAVDDEGNRVEVKMRKAKSRDTKFVTPRRINI